MSKPVIYKKDKTFALKEIVALVFFALCLVLFAIFFGRVSDGNVERQREALEDGLTRCITECYAEEGMYPGQLEYLEDNYGLTYDKDLFYVDYQVRGANIRPDYTIIDLTDGE